MKSSLLVFTMSWAAVSIFGLIFLIGSINANKHPNIVGGSNALIKHFPYLVSLRRSGDHRCGGSIISDRHILTAAHCMHFVDPDDLTIHSGTSSSQKEGTFHEILSAHCHPKFNYYDVNGGNDVCVLTLTNPMNFTKYQQKINLPSHDIQSYQAAYAVGWGKLSSTIPKAAIQLQKLRVVLVPFDKCQRFLEHKVDEKQVCAFRSVGSGICHGDSGGPLVSHDEIVGIDSFIDKGTCAAGVPDVFTNVFAYKDFINSVINDPKM